MRRLNGNTLCILQTATYTPNNIGESVAAWTNSLSVKGYLDMMSGTSRYNEYDAKVAEATHVFMCDYNEAILLLDPSSLRAEIDGKPYEVLYIDDPVGINRIVEIYLKRVELNNNAGESS